MYLLGVTWELQFTIPLKQLREEVGTNGVLGTVSPHGCYSMAALFLGVPAFRCDRELRKLDLSVLGASVLFYVPFVREYLLLFGAREATRDTASKMIKEGKITVLCPGKYLLKVFVVLVVCLSYLCPPHLR